MTSEDDIKGLVSLTSFVHGLYGSSICSLRLLEILAAFLLLWEGGGVALRLHRDATGKSLK
jgi:hypothetical protein